MLRIEIPRLPPYECGLNFRSKSYWPRLNATREAHREVIALVREQQAVGEPLAHAEVTVTFVVPDKRVRDKGNLIAQAKPFVDALKLAGVIKDDKWTTTNEVYPFIVYEKGVRKTIIEVSEA